MIDPRVPPILIDPHLEGPHRIPTLPAGQQVVPAAPAIEVDHHFEVIRSADLVSLIVSTAGFDLADVTGDFDTFGFTAGSAATFALPTAFGGEDLTSGLGLARPARCADDVAILAIRRG